MLQSGNDFVTDRQTETDDTGKNNTSPKPKGGRHNCCNYPKICTMWFYHAGMHPKDKDRMANSVDPDHTA